MDGILYFGGYKVRKDWTLGNGWWGEGQDPLVVGTTNWGIGGSTAIMNSTTLSCTMGCSERADGVRVVGCIFDGGHVCDWDIIWEPIFHFMLDRTGAAAASPASEINC